MRETQVNIKRYKEQMSLVKYKIASVAVMLIISVAMLTTTSFAWLVLSTSPEVSSITTSIAGNGNLEIALGSSDEAGKLKYPDESTSSDGSISDLTIKNTTWGNLINLGDAAYGLHKITLKPASLYTSNLIESPLAAIKYDKDGRPAGVDASGLKYSNFDATINSGEGAFVVGNYSKYGVRAVSATRATNMQGIAIKNKVDEIRNGNLQKVKDNYKKLIDDNISTVAKLMGEVMTEGLNDSSTNYYSYIDEIVALMDGFLGVYEDTFSVYASIVNMMSEQEKLNIEDYTGSMIVNSLYNEDGTASSTPFNEAYFKKLGVNNNKEYDMLNGLDEIITDYKRVKSDMISLQGKLDDPNVTVLTNDELLVPVNYLCDIYSCKIDNDKTVTQLMADKMAAISLLSGTHQGTITKGALVRFEQTTGAKMNVTGQQITVKYMVTVNVNANIDTAAKAPFSIDNDLGALERYLNNGAALTETATDIYGMVIDFFLRTNAKDANIILEGEPVTEFQVLTQKINDKEYDVYEIQGVKYYFVPSSGTGYLGNRDLTSTKLSQAEINYLTEQVSKNGKFINYSTGVEYNGSLDNLDVNNDIQYALKTVVIGYDGVNRVWEESVNLNDGNMSATQGKGSCYIFYPTSVTEHEQMLNLLAGLKVVFLSDEGKILTIAHLNTKLAYESAGKVIVPLELTDYNTVPGNDKDIPIITKINQNETTFISAIVYLDGELVTNDLVDATTGVNGYLNLQFGTDIELNPMEDDELKNQMIKVNGFLGSAENPLDTVTLNYGKGNLNVGTYVNITGISASKVTANFVRQLNTSQGVIMDPITFNQQEDGSWYALAKFDSPGDYILRSVWVDGVEYEFSQNKVLKVSIDGLSINNIWLDTNESIIYKMTSDSRFTTNTYVTFGANDAYVPKDVKALYVGDNGVVTVTFNKNSENQWQAPVTFNESGTYTLTTLIVDGDPIDVPEQLRKTLYLYLGIDVDVDLQSVGATYQGTPTSTTAEVYVYDKNGKIMSDLSNVYLRYNMSGNSTTSAIAKVEWNSSKKCYVGELSFKTPGIYEFYSLGINKTVISNDTELEDVVLSNYLYEATADKFSYLTMEAPKFESDVTEKYQFAPDKDAKFILGISNSMAASGKATLVHTKDNTKKVVDGLQAVKTEGTLSTWEIAIPEVASDIKQNGEWKVESLLLTNVYVNGNMYMLDDSDIAHDYYEISIPEISTYVVNDVKVSFTNSNKNNASFEVKDFTYSIAAAANTSDNSFARTNYRVTVTDYYGVELNTDSSIGDVINADVKPLLYDYTPVSWFTSGKAETSQHSFNNKVIDRIAFANAGTYSPRLELVIGDYNYSIQRTNNQSSGITVTEINNKGNILIVSDFIYIETLDWNRPDVVFSGVKEGSGGTPTGTSSISADGKSATLYYATKSSSNGCGGTSTTYYPAQVKVKVSNAGLFESGSFNIVGDTVEGSGCDGDTATNVKFTIDKSSKESGFVGIGEEGVKPTNIHGDTVELTYNKVTYTFTIAQPVTVTMR